MHRGNSMRKPTRCQLCQVVQHSKCHCGFLFCSLSRKQESQIPPANGAPCPLLISFPAKPKPLGFPRSIPSSGGCCQWCVSAGASSSQQDRARPWGSRQRGAIPSGCCRYAAVPPCPPVLAPSPLQEKYFSFFLLPGSSASAYFQWVSSSSDR